jgi:hypothetical protein
LHEWILVATHRMFDAFFDTIQVRIPHVRYQFSSNTTYKVTDEPGSFSVSSCYSNPDLVIDFYVHPDWDYRHMVGCSFSAKRPPDEDAILVRHSIGTDMDDLVALPWQRIPLPLTPAVYHMAMEEALEEMRTLMESNRDLVVHELLTADRDRRYLQEAGGHDRA